MSSTTDKKTDLTKPRELEGEDLSKLHGTRLDSGIVYKDLVSNSGADGKETTLIPIPPKKVPMSLLCQICMEEPQFYGLQQRINYAEQQVGGQPKYIVARHSGDSTKRIRYDPPFHKNLWRPDDDVQQKSEDPVKQAWQYQQYLRYVQQQRDQHLSYLQYQQWLQWYLKNNPQTSQNSNNSFVLQQASQPQVQPQAHVQPQVSGTVILNQAPVSHAQPVAPVQQSPSYVLSPVRQF